jgi:hypothetical protein
MGSQADAAHRLHDVAQIGAGPGGWSEFPFEPFLKRLGPTLIGDLEGRGNVFLEPLD